MNITIRMGGGVIYHFELYPDPLGTGVRGRSPNKDVSAFVGFDQCDNCGKFKQDVRRIVSDMEEEFYDLCHECEKGLSESCN